MEKIYFNPQHDSTEIELCADAKANSLAPEELVCELNPTDWSITFMTGAHTTIDVASACASITTDENIAKDCRHDLEPLRHENGVARLTIRQTNGVQFDPPDLWDAPGFDPMGVIEKVKTAPYTQDTPLEISTPVQTEDTFSRISELSKRSEIQDALFFESIIGLIVIISFAASYIRSRTKRKLQFPTPIKNEVTSIEVNPRVVVLSLNDDLMNPQHVDFDRPRKY